MQINGIGNNHSSDMHQVTKCMHNHETTQKSGGAAMSSSNLSPQEIVASASEQTSTFSLAAWLRDTVQSAKKLWGKIWGSADAAENLQNTTEHVPNITEIQNNEAENTKEMFTTKQGQETVDNAQLHGAHAAVASMAVTPGQTVNNNPYFTTVEDIEIRQQTLWQKIRVRFQNITGFLTKHFSFSNKNNFQPKQEQQKEDLRRRSRYRKDDLEIDCVITDESYLMDSYNKQGEYSRITTQK